MRIVVGRDESIKTINEALKIVNDENNEIYIKNGIYKEKIIIDKPNVKLIGESRDQTIITFFDYAKKLDELNHPLETFRSYTVLVLGNNVTIENLTIKNESGFGSIVGQAVSLFVNSDYFYLKDCNLFGYQDTLLTGPIPRDAKNQEYLTFTIDHDAMYQQIYENCLITGDIDFIFGSASAYFYKCQIKSHNLKNRPGYISAPSTLKGRIGHVFLECELRSDTNDKTIYLGRPWREYGYAAYIKCFMDEHIASDGFTVWSGTNRHETACFYEYQNYGPGSIRNDSTLSKQLSEIEVNELYKYFEILKKNK